MPETVVKFGTDGWRGIIADDFTYENVRVAARAIAHYVLKHEDPTRGVCVGWDTRFASCAFAGVVAEVLATAGIPVALASEITPTPALSYAVRERKAAGGVMITSSHNPAQWNGVKYKASYGGSGTPAIMTSIESYLGQPLPAASAKARIEEVAFNPDYVTALARFVDLHAIHASKYRFLIDDMYGCGRGIIASIFRRAEIPCVEIRSELNPLFPGINPEPILPHIKAAQEAVVKNKCDAGLITDGDADRIGAVDEHGNVVDAHKIFAVLLNWLLELQEVAGATIDAGLQYYEDDRPYRRETWPQTARARHRLQVRRRPDAGERDPDRRRGVRRHRHQPAPAGARRALKCAADRQRDGGREEDPRPVGRRPAGRIRRASVRTHRYAHR